MAKSVRHYINRIKQGALGEMKKQFAWVYDQAKKHRTAIIIYTIIGMSGTVVSLISSLVSRDLVDIITGHRTGELLVTFLAMIAITLGSTLIGQLSSYLSTKITLRVENDIKARYFDTIMETEWEELNRYHSGELAARWNGDVSIIANGILNLAPNAMIYTFRFISALYMVIAYDWSFAIFALASVPISLLTSREAMKRMRKSNMNSMRIGEKMSGFHQETFSNIQTVKAFDMLSLYSKQLRELQQEYTQVRLKYQKMAIINAIILTLVSMLVSYAAQGWGVYKVWSGAITYGTMTMFLSLSTTLSGTVNNLISLFPSSITLSNATKRLMELAELPKENCEDRELVKEFSMRHNAEGIGLRVENVTYAYPGGENVLEHVCMEAFPHEVVALVGPSGEGKTTMLRYLLALLRPSEGGAFLCSTDGSEEERIALSASSRQLMAYVPQGNTMFSGTIAENMRKVKPEASDEEIVEALKLACAWGFVSKLPDGIDTKMQERGGGFSEGQSQRLSIARALLRRSPILLLDEATSALDVATEREVLRNIMKDDYPRTCVVTTHRPTVLSLCTRVYGIREKSCSILTEAEVEQLIKDF